MRLINPAVTFASIVLILYLIKQGSDLANPVIIAIVMWYLIISLSDYYKNLTVKSFHIPHGITIFLSIATIFIIFSGIITLINGNIHNVKDASRNYGEKFQHLISQNIDIPIIDITVTLQDLSEYIDEESYTNALGQIGQAAGKIPSYMVIIILFTIFLLLEYQTFHQKIHSLVKEKAKRNKIENLFYKINTDIQTYLKIKTIASFSTGLFSYCILLGFGIEFASFWAMLIFLFNFIPTIGSIVAVLFVVIFVLFDTNNFALFFILGTLLTAIQILIGGIIEPRYLGKSLNLSPIVIFLSLLLWGIILGPIGMFLCVPIMVILNIIMANFEKTRPIAILLSSNGKVEFEKRKKKKKFFKKLQKKS